MELERILTNHGYPFDTLRAWQPQPQRDQAGPPSTSPVMPPNIPVDNINSDNNNGGGGGGSDEVAPLPPAGEKLTFGGLSDSVADLCVELGLKGPGYKPPSSVAGKLQADAALEEEVLAHFEQLAASWQGQIEVRDMTSLTALSLPVSATTTVRVSVKTI